MVQEIKSINDIYLNLFKKDKANAKNFIDPSIDDNLNLIVDNYDKNLRLIKLISEDSNNIIEVNCFFNLSSISLLAGKPKKIIKISNDFNDNYYKLINYINDVDLLLYEDFNASFNSLEIDFLYINNLNDNNNFTLYNKIFNNINIKKYIMIEGLNEYFQEKLMFMIQNNNWKIYSINETKFDFLILKKNIIS